jgi:hypothetical protein
MRSKAGRALLCGEKRKGGTKAAHFECFSNNYSFESECDSDSSSEIMSPFLIAGDRIPVSEWNVIELQQSNCEISSDFDVDSASGAKGKIRIRAEVFQLSSYAADQYVSEAFNGVSSGSEPRSEQKVENAEIDVWANDVELLLVIAEVRNYAEISREVCRPAEANPVKSLPLLCIERIVGIDVCGKERIPRVHFASGIVALRASRNRRDHNRPKQKNQSLHNPSKTATNAAILCKRDSNLAF